MNGNSRYASGSSLEKTKKEDLLDSLESLLGGGMSDGLYTNLKQMTIKSLRELREIVESHELEWKERILSQDPKGGR